MGYSAKESSSSKSAEDVPYCDLRIDTGRPPKAQDVRPDVAALFGQAIAERVQALRDVGPTEVAYLVESLAADRETYRRGWNRADKFLAEERAARDADRADAELMLADLTALLRALGMGDHARPESPHAVMQSAIAKVSKLAAARADAERLRVALLKLTNEIDASVGMDIGLIRHAIGNTNYACLELRIKEARSALGQKDA